MTLARRLLLPLLALVASLALSACGTPTAAPTAAPRTAMDQTEAEKRANVRIELAAGYFSRGQYSTALDEVKQALLLRPGMREAVNLRGLIYGAMGERALAEESFKNALALYPNDPDTLHNYGWMLCQGRRFPEATQQFELALAQNTYRAPARTFLAKGVCEAQAKDYGTAEKTLLRAFEFDPGNPAVAYNLADVLYKNGQYERALFYIKRVNSQAEQSNAQSLWLALRIERRMKDSVAVSDLGRQMRQRYADAPETQALNAERFDD